jgi:ketosteroid isomerase-like protein
MVLARLILLALLALAERPGAASAQAPGIPPASMAIPDSGFQAFLVEFEAATTDFLNGDARAWIANASHADDVSLFNPFGMIGKGWTQVGAMYAKGASRLSPRGAALAVEYLTIVVAGDQAYTIAIERSTFRPTAQDPRSAGLTRATDLFRREAGHWKLVHRHMDHLRPPE